MPATPEKNDDLQFYLDVANLGRWTYDTRDSAVICDQRCAAFLGASETTVELETLVGRIDAEDQAKLARCFGTAGDTGSSFSVSFRIHDHELEEWRSLTLKGRWLSAREASGVLSVDELDDQSLRLSESELTGKVIDAIPFAVMYITRDGSVDFTNRAFRRATGSSVVETERRPVGDVLSTEERDNGARAFIECLTTGCRVSREGETAVPGKPTRLCRYVYEPVKDRNGEVLGVVSTVVDITDIKEAELALEASNEDLSRSNEDLEQFAYVASHDLKAPLRSIEVLVGWLAEDLAEFESGDVQENLDLLKQRTVRLNRLLDDLLEYSRAGRKIGVQSQTDCRALVEDVVMLMDVPEQFRVVADRSLPVIDTYHVPLEQVLRNLVSNAIKHHPGPVGTVTVGAERHEDHYLFSVTDDGSGIPDEYADRVFEMFQTLRPRDEVEGSGMGLAIVNRIVNWQGGRAWFETPPSGVGTVFKFEWKLDQSETIENSRKNAA